MRRRSLAKHNVNIRQASQRPSLRGSPVANPVPSPARGHLGNLPRYRHHSRLGNLHHNQARNLLHSLLQSLQRDRRHSLHVSPLEYLRISLAHSLRRSRVHNLLQCLLHSLPQIHRRSQLASLLEYLRISQAHSLLRNRRRNRLLPQDSHLASRRVSLPGVLLASRLLCRLQDLPPSHQVDRQRIAKRANTLVTARTDRLMRMRNVISAQNVLLENIFSIRIYLTRVPVPIVSQENFQVKLVLLNVRQHLVGRSYLLLEHKVLNYVHRVFMLQPKETWLVLLVQPVESHPELVQLKSLNAFLLNGTSFKVSSQPV